MPKKELQDEMTLTLRQSVTLGKGADAETYDHLKLREPLAAEMLDFSQRSKGDAGDALRRLIAKISGVPLAVIDRMKVRDFNAAANYLTPFMDPDLEQDGDDDADESGGRETPAGDPLGK